MTSLLGSACGKSLKSVRSGACPQRTGITARINAAPRRRALAGRAEDVALKIGYRVDARWTAAVGYRMVEGGADNDEGYTFAWLHCAVASVRYDF